MGPDPQVEGTIYGGWTRHQPTLPLTPVYSHCSTSIDAIVAAIIVVVISTSRCIMTQVVNLLLLLLLYYTV